VSCHSERLYSRIVHDENDYREEHLFREFLSVTVPKLRIVSVEIDFLQAIGAKHWQERWLQSFRKISNVALNGIDSYVRTN